jgi:hypothetical protein
MNVKVPMISTLFVLGATGLAALIGCEQSAQSGPPAKPSTETSKPAAADSALPATLWLATEPASAKPVAEIKQSAAAGQDVVVFGRIGGSKEPFVSGRAMFTLADRSIPSCVEKHGPGCATPWDYCCEAKDTVLASTITVQVTGADGKPLKTGLSDVHGLKPLTDLVITGKVSSAGSNVVIDAQGIYLKK